MQLFACNLRHPPDCLPDPAPSTLAAISDFSRLSLYLCPPWFQYNLISPSERGHRSITRGSSPARLVLACIGAAASSLLSCAFVGHLTAECDKGTSISSYPWRREKNLVLKSALRQLLVRSGEKPGFEDAEALAPRAGLARPREKHT